MGYGSTALEGVVIINRDFWVNKKVFITGATGLLGSWLTEALMDLGSDITILVRDWVPQSRVFRENFYSKVKIAHGHVENLALLERIINENEIDTVFHLAAQTIVEIANHNPMSTFEANIRGTWNLLDACRRVSGVRRIIVASSDKAYGSQSQPPFNEEMPMMGNQPYDVSKSCVDLIARCYYLAYNLPVCVTRCGNFYGGGDLNFNRLIPGTISALLKGESPIIRSDGSMVRDYLYIKDAVRAYLQLAQSMDSLPVQGQAFNFSNEQPLTVMDVVRKIAALVGKEHIEPTILNQAVNEVHQQYLSTQKAREVLQWQPKYSLDQGLAETVAWYRQFLGGDKTWISTE